MSREQFSRTLSYVTSAVGNSAELAAQCAYFVSYHCIIIFFSAKVQTHILIRSALRSGPIDEKVAVG